MKISGFIRSKYGVVYVSFLNVWLYFYVGEKRRGHAGAMRYPLVNIVDAEKQAAADNSQRFLETLIQNHCILCELSND